ncbi:hypothetical protein [Streptomyces sp. NPDC020681]|uniref:hypothetical protein n=1 Tax=Streptomyces sp. NPDC020681 TaxID=3365083 RepID=UPI00379AD146
MVRFVHKQLATALVCILSGVTGWAVASAVNGPPDLPGWWFPLAMLGWAVLWSLLSTTRLLGGGDVTLFRTAVPLADPATAGRAPFVRAYGLLLAAATLLTTAVALYEPLAVVFNLFWAMDPLMRAERAARWERGRGVLLWQGRTVPPDQRVRAGSVFTTPRGATPVAG